MSGFPFSFWKGEYDKGQIEVKEDCRERKWDLTAKGEIPIVLAFYSRRCPLAHFIFVSAFLPSGGSLGSIRTGVCQIGDLGE